MPEHSVTLTKFQKIVLVKLMKGQSKTVILDNAKKNERSNYVSAFNQIERKGLIKPPKARDGEDSDTEITKTGKTAMTDAGLLDDSEELTFTAKKLAGLVKKVKKDDSPFGGSPFSSRPLGGSSRLSSTGSGSPFKGTGSSVSDRMGFGLKDSLLHQINQDVILNEQES